MSGPPGANPCTTRVLKSSPSGLSKQGPIKATIPMSSLVKQSSSLQKSPTIMSSYCTTNTTWKNTISSNHSGQRSPGSSINKGNVRCLSNAANGGSAIRRTASLDTIYVSGQWPRESNYCVQPALQINKATQTDECDWVESRKIHLRQDSDERMMDKFRHRLQRSNNQQTSSSRISPITGDHTLTTSSQTNTSFIIPRATPAVSIPIKPLPRPTMRNSVEGLNQEIEGFVLKAAGDVASDRSEDYDKLTQITPEGHRAPLPDLFRNTRSVNTQTPSLVDVTGSCQSSSGSRGSSPDADGGGGSRLGTSPRMFLARGPPDGCERVHLVALDERRSLPLDNAPQPSNFQLKPSQGSAFKILQPASKDHPPIVPTDEQDLI
ncbi:PREDICTED: protein FAM117B-like isoform X2 [Nicrophorus vespilloides]|uniref:Protein FAM117B-like isoform X2 n=1 Tax=Nicrophorus vespilloides TaxID=110193 RepID=A0ABM1ML54_NICVS|nr:PREDICTED: protein FAM117B-like isoform X2 [Nicrophorus vespilloides]